MLEGVWHQMLEQRQGEVGVYVHGGVQLLHCQHGIHVTCAPSPAHLTPHHHPALLHQVIPVPDLSGFFSFTFACGVSSAWAESQPGCKAGPMV